MTELHEPVCIYLARAETRPAGTVSPQWQLCFIPAPSLAAARDRLPRVLGGLGLELLQVEMVQPYWDYEWPAKAQQRHYDRLAQQAYRSRETVLSPSNDDSS